MNKIIKFLHRLYYTSSSERFLQHIRDQGVYVGGVQSLLLLVK